MKKITKAEVSDLITILKKVRLPVPYPVFIALCKSVPMIAVDLALMPDKDRILLTYRKDEFFDCWHIPGSILRFNDSVNGALRRVARKELGIIISESKFMTYLDYRDKRVRGISLLFVVRSKSKPKSGKYFHLNRLPKKFLKNQQAAINYLKKSAY